MKLTMGFSEDPEKDQAWIRLIHSVIRGVEARTPLSAQCVSCATSLHMYEVVTEKGRGWWKRRPEKRTVRVTCKTPNCLIIDFVCTGDEIDDIVPLGLLGERLARLHGLPKTVDEEDSTA